MKRRRAGLLATGALVIAAAAAWWILGRRAGVLTAAPAHLVVAWQGPHPGRMSLPAQLRWCPVTRIGVLEGVSGDSGVVVALTERNTMASGSYAILAPSADNARPTATAALRWVRMDRDSALEQYRSTSGTFGLQLTGAMASGTVLIHMHSAAPLSHDSLVLRGVFRAVPVLTTAVGCS